MAQVTLYVDDETSAIIAAAAKSAGMSKSKWVTTVIKKNACKEWPQAARDLAGAWVDFPLAEDIRRGLGEDSPRVDG